MKRIKEAVVIISLFCITMINAQTNENIGVNKEILGVLGENYTIEKYKSRHNKTYLTLQVFIDNILQKDLYIVSINGDSFWIKKKESTTFIVSPKQSYEVGASAFVTGILKIPHIIPRKRDSLLIKAYLKSPPKVVPAPKYGKIAILGKDYFINTYKSKDKKTYLTFHIFEYNTITNSFHITINDEEADFKERKESITYLVEAKKNYDVEFSSFKMQALRIPKILPQEGDSLAIKTYLSDPIKYY